MKKVLLAGVSLCAVLLLAGCLGPKADNYGFPTVPGGILFSDMKTAQIVDKKILPETRKYKVIKRVKAEATTTSFIGVVSVGDASFATLKAQALAECREADDIIDLEVDGYHNNILGLINKVTCTIRGVAIQYTDKY